MNILHVSDLHFGQGHWQGNNQILLEKLNSYSADLVINTGDSTTDSKSSEFQEAGQFLKSIHCPQLISVIGNHDKRSPESLALFRENITDSDFIKPLDPGNCSKKYIFAESAETGNIEVFTDVNYIQKVTVRGETLLLVCLDSTQLHTDNGFVDLEMLRSVSRQIENQTFDRIILLLHHSIVDTDSDPLFNSWRVIDFVKEHGIEHVFCGHTHKLELKRSTDLIGSHSFVQYKNGSLSSGKTPYDANMFLFLKNFGEKDMVVHVVRIAIEGGQLIFEEELLRDIIN